MARYPLLILDRTANIRAKAARDVDLDAFFTKRIYKEQQCASCDNLENRHDFLCDGCPAYLEKIVMWDVRRFNGKAYVSVPWGDRALIEKLFNVDYDDEVLTDDRRARPPMPRKLKFTGKLFTGKEKFQGRPTNNQVRLVNKWAKAGGGFIEAPPRSGKTMLATYISCAIGMRTLIVAHKKPLLDQFERTFHAHTNAKRIAERRGLDVKDIVLNIGDQPEKLTAEKISKASVVLVNYQKFITKLGKKRLRKLIRGNFGLVCIDEAHQGSATAYAMFINSIDSTFRLGLSATPDRRDNRHLIGRMILGKVVAKATSSALVPEIDVVETGFSLPPGKFQWHQMMKRMETDKKRLKLIVKNLKRDIEKNNHTCVIIPVRTKRYMSIYHEALRREFGNDAVQMLYDRKDKGKSTPDILRAVEKKQTKVLIAMDSMIKQGIDMYRPTLLYLTYPMSDWNMFYQLANRPCTPLEGKRQPVVKIFVDDFNASRGCFATILFRAIHPYLPGNKAKKPIRYLLSPNIRGKIYDMGRKQPTKGVMRGKKRF